MVGKTHLSGIKDMKIDEVSEARLWKTLDSIFLQLKDVNTQLTELVRLEERVNQHDKVLQRFGISIDNHDTRIHESELWQAKNGDKTLIERMIKDVKTEVDDMDEQLTYINKKVSKLDKVTESISTITSDIKTLKSTQDINKGQKDIGKEILKWIVAILTGVLIFKFRGS